MTLFLILAALMAGIAVALVVWPLVRARASEGGHALIPAATLALLVPLAAGALYYTWSSWDWNADAGEVKGQLTVPQMMARLEARLQKNPDDLAGWQMLGRSQLVLGDYAKAALAFEHAYTLSAGKDAEAAAGLAESLARQDEHALDGRAGELIEEALKDDPHNARALWIGGLTAQRRGQPQVARERWATLLTLGPPPEVASLLATRIAEIDKQLGRPADPAIAELARAAVAPETPPAMAAQGGAGAPAAVATSGASGGSVHVTVTLAAAVRARVGASDTLFVLARDPNAPGPPLAVRRFPPGQALPVEVVLTAQDAMIPTRSLATARQVTVVARFSKGGQPIAASGDVYGELPYDASLGRPAELKIDKVVP